MSIIEPVAETADTITLRRPDFEAMLAALEDAGDSAVLRQAEMLEARDGKAARRALYMTAEGVQQLMAGAHPVQVWRLQRGLTLAALSGLAGISRSYLTEIEGFKKPGSAAAYQKLARALGVAMDDVVPGAG